MLKLETTDSGRVVNGTFSKRSANGLAYPTKEAVYLLTEAFELDQPTDPYQKISRKTRYILAKKYSVSSKLMILSTRELGMRINGNDNVNKIARDLAFAAYNACR